MTDFKLSAQLVGHEADVGGVQITLKGSLELTGYLGSSRKLPLSRYRLDCLSRL